MFNQHVIGVDLGQAQDYTAISILRSNMDRQEVIFLERLKLDTSYPDVVRHIESLMFHPKLMGKATLVVDYTGCGRPNGRHDSGCWFAV